MITDPRFSLREGDITQQVERFHVICYNAEVSQAYRARLHAKDAE